MRTFILGVGSQKSGTTWLFKQIIKSENYARGFSKEYHLFDVINTGGLNSDKNNIRRRIKNYPFQQGEEFIEKSHQRMLSFYQDSNNYFDYFDSILTTEQSFTSDITPSYSGLSSEVLKNIKDQFNKRGINLKIIFLMREPVTRLESSIKMKLRREKKLKETSNANITEMLYTGILSEDNKLRSDYAYTCSQIDQVFSPNEVFYGFYETLFSTQEIQRLSFFLDLPEELFDAEYVINATPDLFKYNAKDLKNYQEAMKDRYTFVNERFDFDLAVWDAAVKKILNKPEEMQSKNLIRKLFDLVK